MPSYLIQNDFKQLHRSYLLPENSLTVKTQVCFLADNQCDSSDEYLSSIYSERSNDTPIQNNLDQKEQPIQCHAGFQENRYLTHLHSESLVEIYYRSKESKKIGLHAGFVISSGDKECKVMTLAHHLLKSDRSMITVKSGEKIYPIVDFVTDPISNLAVLTISGQIPQLKFATMTHRNSRCFLYVNVSDKMEEYFPSWLCSGTVMDDIYCQWPHYLESLMVKVSTSVVPGSPILDVNGDVIGIWTFNQLPETIGLGGGPNAKILRSIISRTSTDKVNSDIGMLPINKWTCHPHLHLTDELPNGILVQKVTESPIFDPYQIENLYDRLQIGDLIIEIDDIPVGHQKSHWSTPLLSKSPGDIVKIKVYRSRGQIIILHLPLTKINPCNKSTPKINFMPIIEFNLDHHDTETHCDSLIDLTSFPTSDIPTDIKSQITDHNSPEGSSDITLDITPCLGSHLMSEEITRNDKNISYQFSSDILKQITSIPPLSPIITDIIDFNKLG
jgi:hypothetical protein